MRLGIMCSGNGTNFENIVTNPICKEHEVVLMIHNTKKCGAVARAAKWGIPHVRIAHKEEDRMIEMFKAWGVDLIILAGYMRVLKNPSKFPCPIINVHPSLLPKYKGLNVVERAMEAGEEVTGCTVHYVNEELDGGEIILQGKVPIMPDDSVESLTKAIQRMEYAILPAAIQQLKEKNDITRRQVSLTR
tara:strand:+ start:572 stop:1138 length:567 start_codon:yes stop_codon:yes gene_type:complete